LEKICWSVSALRKGCIPPPVSILYTMNNVTGLLLQLLDEEDNDDRS
jgi:hypothetical protein